MHRAVLIGLALLHVHVVVLDDCSEVFDHVFLLLILEDDASQGRPLLYMQLMVPSSALTPLSRSFLALLNSLRRTISLRRM